MKIGDNATTSSPETANSQIRGNRDSHTAPSATGENDAGTSSGDAVAPGVGRDLVRLAQEAGSIDRQAKIEELQLRLENDEYSVDAQAVSRAIVDEMIESAVPRQSSD